MCKIKILGNEFNIEQFRPIGETQLKVGDKITAGWVTLVVEEVIGTMRGISVYSLVNPLYLEDPPSIWMHSKLNGFHIVPLCALGNGDFVYRGDTVNSTKDDDFSFIADKIAVARYSTLGFMLMDEFETSSLYLEHVKLERA